MWEYEIDGELAVVQPLQQLAERMLDLIYDNSLRELWNLLSNGFRMRDLLEVEAQSINPLVLALESPYLDVKDANEPGLVRTLLLARYFVLVGAHCLSAGRIADTYRHVSKLICGPAVIRSTTGNLSALAKTNARPTGPKPHLHISYGIT